MQEHRKLPRWQINRQAKLKLEQALQAIFCQVKDINYKGARITLNTKLPLDAELKISLQLAENYTIEAQVWVVWHKIVNGINHYGLYFNRIKDVDKEKLYKFISAFYPNNLEHKWYLKATETEQEKGGEEMKDHRIFERFAKEFSARFIGLDGTERQAQTFDVSAKGLGLATDQELKSNTALEIWLDVPNSTDPVYTRGQVVWSRLAGAAGYRSGIELERADLMGMSRLLRA